MANILITPDNATFTTDDNETILMAGLRNKLNMPHQCKNGVCGSCKCKVISGTIKHDEYNQKTLTAEELHEGYALLCKAHAKTDVVLEIPNLLNSFPIRMLPAKVESLEKFNGVAVIKLKTPNNIPFLFHAGQYIDIILNGKNRSYSIANAPTNTSYVELHVRYHASGIFSEFIWHEAREQSMLRFRGPLGNFYLRDTNNPIILVCTGTGFAPIKAIVESMINTNNTRHVTLYWGNRDIEDFYMLDLVKSWQNKLNITINLCLSSGVVAGFSHGRVTQAILKDFTDLANYEIYACGNPKMTEDVFELATSKLNLIVSNFLSDAFTPSVI
jgi:CDP-4-dehydro-6-deoxyglucose reductase